MTELLENAIRSIQLGIEDYQSNDQRRPISAVRNFYAGVLLLGKQCLLNVAPDADPKEILASHFIPVPDGAGGVVHEPRGYRTIDLGELKERFKAFDLSWPDGDISALQRLRNDFEHFHSPAPKEAIQQAIAGCFPIVDGFFQLLELSPAETLGDTWDIMLTEKTFFKKQKAECDSSFHQIPWFNILTSTNAFECPACHSSLIYQDDPNNSTPEFIEGHCKACGERLSAEDTVALIVEGEFGVEDYVSYKDGAEPVIHDCTECFHSTYVMNGEINQCLLCGGHIEGECARCMADLTIETMSVNNSSLCSYCDHIMSKDD